LVELLIEIFLDEVANLWAYLGYEFFLVLINRLSLIVHVAAGVDTG
jgi:hypothetical protein